MGFNHSAILLGCVLFCGHLASALPQGEGAVEIRVMLENRVKIPRRMLQHAEGEAARILGEARIHVDWIDCAQVATCHHVPGRNEFVLSIVADGKTSSELVYGVAFLGPAGEGKYADIFFRRMEAAAMETGANVPRLLGTVMAHELGHLLLGSNAHNFEGIMSPVWKTSVLRRMEMGSLLFTQGEAAAMRGKLAGEDGAEQLPAYTRARPRNPLP